MDETIIYLDDVLRVLYKVQEELWASYRFYDGFIASCSTSVTNEFEQMFAAQLAEPLTMAEEAYAEANTTLVEIIDVVIILKDAVVESNSEAEDSRAYVTLIMFALVLSVFIFFCMLLPTLVVMCHQTANVWPRYARVVNKFQRFMDAQWRKMPCVKEEDKEDLTKGGTVELKGAPDAPEIYIVLGAHPSPLAKWDS
ncbi:hypothetical protein CYMTET_35777 [Cymbomonas tetramitiformis]|uniref:Uncharacterized protein n=1 Tax=Cymbomonas tetramitiformis TaxID=36881 RepID=A0AAE0F8K9_9CHLO|nr:hypothetical protein CYMTET_35777 [Cymbomonas tetramitiformis]